MKSKIFFLFLLCLSSKSLGETGTSSATGIAEECSESKKNCLRPPDERDFSAVSNKMLACKPLFLSMFGPEEKAAVITEPSEKNLVVLECFTSDKSKSIQFQPSNGIDFETEIHFSYRTRSGALVKDASKSLKYRDIIEKGFTKSELYKSLLAEGATEIKLSYLTVSRDQKMSSVADKLKVCSFNTCPSSTKKSWSEKIGQNVKSVRDYFTKEKNPAAANK